MPSPRPCAEMDDFFAAGPDLEAMGRAELLDCLAAVRQRIARLDQEEPEDMDSETYDNWADRLRLDRHEALEDLADDILDRLDELDGP